jgi:hypothetical protein
MSQIERQYVSPASWGSTDEIEVLTFDLDGEIFAI